jgi:arginine/lysine/ornithine decarboxylase
MHPGTNFFLQSFTCITAEHTQKKNLGQYLLTIEQMVENNHPISLCLAEVFQSQIGRYGSLKFRLCRGD